MRCRAGGRATGRPARSSSSRRARAPGSGGRVYSRPVAQTSGPSAECQASSSPPSSMPSRRCSEIERADDSVDVDDALVGEALGIGEDRKDAGAQPVLGKRRAIVRKPRADHHRAATVLAEPLRAGVPRHAVADDDHVVAADLHQRGSSPPELAPSTSTIEIAPGRAAATDALGSVAGQGLAGKHVRHAVVSEQERVGLGLDADADADADVVVDLHVHEVVAVGWHGRDRRLRRRRDPDGERSQSVHEVGPDPRRARRPPRGERPCRAAPRGGP